MLLSQSALSFVRDHRVEAITKLQSFIRFPSISSQKRNSNDMQKCADWQASHLRRMVLEQVQVVQTALHPIVSAR